MTVTLKDGFQVEINDAHLDDWQLLKMLRGIDNGEPALIVDVVDRLLGEEQGQALEKHLEVDGITSIASMVDAVRQIMESNTEVKNS